MKNKTCGECKYFDWVGQCDKVIEFNNVHAPDKACSFFEPLTNGDRVRQGGNKRLITFSTEWSCFHCAYHNGIERKCERPEGKDCFDGIEAWLNAPAESENKNEQ